MDKTETDTLRRHLARVLARLENAHATNASPDQVQSWKKDSRVLRDWILESENPFVGVRQVARWVELRPGLRKFVRE